MTQSDQSYFLGYYVSLTGGRNADLMTIRIADANRAPVFMALDVPLAEAAATIAGAFQRLPEFERRGIL